MAVQIVKSICCVNILNAYQFKTQLIKIENAFDSSKPFYRLLKTPKTVDYRESFSA